MTRIFKHLTFILLDIFYFFSNFFYFFSKYNFVSNSISLLFTQLNDSSKYFLKKYVYTINHKSIALNYFFFSFWTGLSGAALATMISMELAHPGSPFFKGDSLKYLQVITAHGLIMVFFVVVPIMFGGFANFLIPYHMGSKDVAYPSLNSIGFWMQPCGFILVAKMAFLSPQYWRYYDKTSYYFPLMEKSSLSESFGSDFFNFFKKHNITGSAFYDYSLPVKTKTKEKYSNFSDFLTVPQKFFFWNDIVKYPESFWFVANSMSRFSSKKLYFTKCSNRTLTTAGWTFMTPFSSNMKYTGVGAQDMLLVSVVFAGISSTVSFTNLLMTSSTLTMPGMSHSSVLLPFVSMGIFLAFSMLALMTPVLGAAMMMMALDSHWQTTFFEFAYGGDPILSQHLFWFFGHPEVYVLIIPTFGFINMMLPYTNTSSVASKHHMMWAIYVMSYMGFLVWGHHMYLVGLDHSSSTMYSTITIMISLPATIKVVNWTLTMVNGALKVDAAFLFCVSYMLFFLVSGFTGMWLSHVGLNVSMHDTFYVIAHFHLMLSGTAMTGVFAGFYYYFTALFGMKYSSMFAYLHLIYYSGGHWMAFLPQFYLGFSGMPSSMHDYPVVFMGWHSMSTAGHFVTLMGIFFFFLMFLDSHIESSLSAPSTLGIPSWNKSISYYIFKISYLQLSQKKMSNTPNFNVSNLLTKKYFNEYESF